MERANSAFGRKILQCLVMGAACAATALGAHADEIKIGLLSQYSGIYSWWGQEYQRGVDLYLAQNGSRVGSHTLTVLPRDEAGSSPQRARQLAQELVIRDRAQYLIGGVFTPTVLGATDIINQTKTPYVILNSGTSSVTDKSPYFVRVGFTQWAVSVPLVKWAVEQGSKKAVILVADYAPGYDGIEAFGTTFKSLGGEIVAEIKVPLGTTDFSTYLQRVRDAGAPTVFMFMPVGPMSAGLIKAYKQRGLDKAGITLLSTNEVQESDLPAIGDDALGLTTALHYTPYLDNPVNKAFVTAYKAKFGADALPSIASVAAYDGMGLIAEMIKATNGKPDGDKAMAVAKAAKWESPRGPVSIDPATREIVQNVYMRKVEKIDGKLGNKAFYTYPAVKDPWHELNRK
jgi:branched-chain amino acid transport system substrate-binding protein